MSAFIHGMGLISAQETFNKVSLDEIHASQTVKLLSREPDYSSWIDPKAIRRMSKIIRTGVAAAKLALQQAGLEKPDAIVTGTGLGCLEDTEIFLNKLIDNKEEALNPTPFIQSTHNTIGSQVALITQCLGYNQTFTHRAFSFELALEDALMLLKENPNQNVLTGSADELTDLSMKVFEKFGWVANGIASTELFSQDHSGTLHGEGAGFFVLNSEKQNAIAELVDVNMIFKPVQASDVAGKMDTMLANAGLKKDDIDLVLSGECGDREHDFLLKEILDNTELSSISFPFKNLCGEYSTASSFAVWLASTILSTQHIPSILAKTDKPVRNILICNQYLNQHHTLILLKAC